MNKQTSKNITEIQECCKLRQETLRDDVWVGDTILLMSFFDKYFNSLFLNDEGVQLWDNLWEEPSRQRGELVQRPGVRTRLDYVKSRKKTSVTVAQWPYGRVVEREARGRSGESWEDESHLDFILYAVGRDWKVLSMKTA